MKINRILETENAEWSYDKGSIKVCKPDETGRKMEHTSDWSSRFCIFKVQKD